MRGEAGTSEILASEFSAKLSSSLTHTQCVLLTVDDTTYAIFKEADDTLSVFDSHAKNAEGKKNKECVVLRTENRL